nr:pentatricopeptide repeat-containing protein, mitochondrial [Quercus suber]
MPNAIGTPPDEDIFITIVHGLGRALLDVLVEENIDLAREFFMKRMMGSGVEGDEYTFGILMKGLCFTNRIGMGKLGQQGA